MRLRPLTLFLPKPLLPLGDEPVVGSTLRELGRIGCEAAMLNLHHLPEAIPSYLGASYYGMPLLYSHEDEIQGTLGGLYLQREFLREADLVLLANGDTFCHWPWRQMIRRHLRSDADITLLVHHRSPNPSLGGGVGVNRQGRVVELRDARIAESKSQHVFAGAHVLSRRILDRLVPGPGDIVGDFYIPLLEEGVKIESVKTRGRWHDIGTPERYLEASLDQLQWWPRRWRHQISPLAEVHSSATIESSLVSPGATIGEKAQIESCVVLSGAEVPAGSKIERSILGPGVRLPPAARIEGRMINRTHLGYQTGSRDSVMGDLVYTPVEDK